MAACVSRSGRAEGVRRSADDSERSSELTDQIAFTGCSRSLAAAATTTAAAAAAAAVGGCRRVADSAPCRSSSPEQGAEGPQLGRRRRVAKRHRPRLGGRMERSGGGGMATRRLSPSPPELRPHHLSPRQPDSPRLDPTHHH
eukprot:GHVU01196815.1.p2 GENE.GHVU01196815.1~~GHVU01196815.1.p2  ORF type:complete len:142 (-),score=15.55 GHVU01196815.1:271-696(-)